MSFLLELLLNCARSQVRQYNYNTGSHEYATSFLEFSRVNSSSHSHHRIDKKLSCHRETARCSCVIEYFVKSISVIRNDILPYINNSLYNFVYLVPFLRYSVLNNGVTLKVWVWGHSKSLKVAPFERFDRPYIGRPL